MNLPRGNALLKETPLLLEDLKLKLANLQHHGFNGYVKADTGDTAYCAFLKEGIVKSVIEISGRNFSLISELLLYHRLRKASLNLSSFVLSPDLVDVLSNWFAFQEKYANYQVRKKEFRKLLSSLDSDKLTGVVEIQGNEKKDSVYFLLSQGHIVTDNFLDAYGQIITGPEKVSDIIEKLSSEGGIINSYGEKFELIDRKGKQMVEELSRYRELTATIESTALRLGGGNVVRVDETVLREWSRYGTVQKVEIIVGQSAPVSYKVTGKKGLGNRISFVSSIQKKLGVNKDELVLVRPT